VSNNKKSTVVITGASGFIGSNLMQQVKLFPQNHFVPVTRKSVPNFVTVKNYADSPEGDILLYLSDENRSDMSFDRSQQNLNSNLETFSKLASKKYKKIIYVSSSALYGDQNTTLNTTYSPIVLNTPYAYLKYHTELLVLKNPNSFVVRLSNVYGPGMSKSNVVSTILSQIPGKGDVQIKSKKPIRDFIWVVDVVEALIKLANVEINTFANRIVNISTGVGTSIGQLASIALQIAQQSDRNVIELEEMSEESSSIMDYSEIKKLINWDPTVKINNGLRTLINSQIQGTK
jgi:nucleoside-diphosphate-sugar epimerase